MLQTNTNNNHTGGVCGGSVCEISGKYDNTVVVVSLIRQTVSITEGRETVAINLVNFNI